MPPPQQEELCTKRAQLLAGPPGCRELPSPLEPPVRGLERKGPRVPVGEGPLEPARVVGISRIGQESGNFGQERVFRFHGIQIG